MDGRTQTRPKSIPKQTHRISAFRQKSKFNTSFSYQCLINLYLYVCMYRGRPLWNCPWNWAIQLGQGEGPIELVGPIFQPRGYHWSRVMHAGSSLHTEYAFCGQLYFGQLRVTRFLMQEEQSHTGSRLINVLVQLINNNNIFTLCVLAFCRQVNLTWYLRRELLAMRSICNLLIL